MRNIENFSHNELVDEVVRLQQSLLDAQFELVKFQEMLLDSKNEYAGLSVEYSNALKTICELENKLSEGGQSFSTAEYVRRERRMREAEERGERKYQEFQELRDILQCENKRGDYVANLAKRVFSLKNK
ncbi:MAG: hypothetical protein FWC11_02620 [Firmicutes bacterium]|nr:hypothetical protein [Bacillota bacterium]MCL2255733.1 hypothetical protein [Bacillota bacterium]